MTDVNTAVSVALPAAPSIFSGMSWSTISAAIGMATAVFCIVAKVINMHFTLGQHSSEIAAIKQRQKDGPHDYVPRSEIEGNFAALREQMASLNANVLVILQTLLPAAKPAPPPAQHPPRR